MRSTLLTIVMALIVMGCASSKKNVYTIVGTWDYTVYNTPNGDSSGELILVETEEGIKGVLSSPDLGDTDLENLVYSGEDKSFSATFWLSMANMDFTITGNFEGDSFSGSVDAGQMGAFDMKAARQIEQ